MVRYSLRFISLLERERPMPDQIAEKVISIITSVKRIPPDAISIESTFEQLGIDSLDGINVLYELEGAFNISIPDEQAKSIHTVRQMVDGIRKLIADGLADAASSRSSA
ncbi:MAG: phosphopantetheine-binding protein [Acidobacteria bacterium]|jgi:acyl carrier protein|nr:MAG: phosphopantetheine-binding protein [Acidobacteriota bacterium]